jgi:putative effector of murein hydrolase LrgA (UPF0299 family)
MNKNLGNTDRLIRIVIGIALIGYAYMTGNTIAYIGIIPIVTSLIGWCALYSLLGINTCGDSCNR